jgi:hypothetical protein
MPKITTIPSAQPTKVTAERPQFPNRPGIHEKLSDNSIPAESSLRPQPEPPKR